MACQYISYKNNTEMNQSVIDYGYWRIIESHSITGDFKNFSSLHSMGTAE